MLTIVKKGLHLESMNQTNEEKRDFVMDSDESALSNSNQKSLSSFVCAITTTGDYANPFDPIEEFDDWYDYDMNVLHLNSAAYLARIFRDSDELTDQEREEAKEAAIDEIIKYDFMNIYAKIKRPNK